MNGRGETNIFQDIVHWYYEIMNCLSCIWPHIEKLDKRGEVIGVCQVSIVLLECPSSAVL